MVLLQMCFNDMYFILVVVGELGHLHWHNREHDYVAANVDVMVVR